MNSPAPRHALALAAALLLSTAGAQASLVTGPGDPAYTTAFQGVSAQTFDATNNYVVGTGPNNLKVYTNTWVDPAGLTFGTLVSPATTAGNPGQVVNKLAYADAVGGSAATNVNARDYFFNVAGVGSSPPGSVSGHVADDKPWLGNVLDLGGMANKAVVFALRDHGPDPQESMEYTIYLTNQPTSTQLSDWHLALLDSVYLEGWEADSVSKADAFTTVWKLPGGAAFRYVSFQPMGSQAFGYGTPGGIAPGGDAELDAIAGLTAGNLPVTAVPEPGSLPLVGASIAALAAFGRRRGVSGHPP